MFIQLIKYQKLHHSDNMVTKPDMLVAMNPSDENEDKNEYWLPAYKEQMMLCWRLKLQKFIYLNFKQYVNIKS